MYEQALAEDPSVFDYDGVYDTMQAEKVQVRLQRRKLMPDVIEHVPYIGRCKYDVVH